MAQRTSETGLKISSTAGVSRLGPTVLATTATTRTERRTVKVFSRSLTAASTPEPSTRMKFLAKESMYGPTVRPTTVCGKRTRCTVKVCSNGKTESSTRVTSKNDKRE